MKIIRIIIIVIEVDNNNKHTDDDTNANNSNNNYCINNDTIIITTEVDAVIEPVSFSRDLPSSPGSGSQQGHQTDGPEIHDQYDTISELYFDVR